MAHGGSLIADAARSDAPPARRQGRFANGRTGSQAGERRYKSSMAAARGRSGVRAWAADFALATAVGGFLGLVGPFGSFFNGPAWQRVAYWVLLGWLGFVVFGLGARLIFRQMRPGARAWTALALYILLMSAPFALLSWTVATAIWPVLAQKPGLTAPVWYAEGLVITASQVALFGALRFRRGNEAGADRAPLASASDLLGVAPGEVLCLQMEDHYVRVHTAGGSRLVLATFAQATDALGRTAGLRIHRSWWVADKAVAGVLADGRNLRLRLTNGLTAPVARSCVAAVRHAGWLERRAGMA
jgi:hypothetical protein